MVVTELHDRPVICNGGELQRFSAPEGQSCGDYMSAFFNNGGPGYIVSNVTNACEYCAFKVADQFYMGLSLNFDDRWRDIGILIAFCGSNLVILFLGVSPPLFFPMPCILRSVWFTDMNTVEIPQFQSQIECVYRP